MSARLPKRRRAFALAALEEALSRFGRAEIFNGHVAELVGIEGGVVSGVINLESSGV
jgi:hypothetical protein